MKYVEAWSLRSCILGYIREELIKTLLLQSCCVITGTKRLNMHQ